jgi:hypothetical protein
MAIGRKRSLPLLDTAQRKAPSGGAHLERARRDLGGRGSTNGDAGMLVALGSAADGLGVVLFASETEVDVWLGAGRVRRTRPERVTQHHGAAPDAMSRVASDARVFAALAEGQRVIYQDETGVAAEGKLVEKCRYGALVARDDGSLLAVGFRRLQPAVSRAFEPS